MKFKLHLLMLLCIIIFSCKDNHINEVDQTIEEETVQDSITINMLVPANTRVGLNAWKKPYDRNFLGFKNDTNRDSIITKKIPLIYNNNAMTKMSWKYNEKGNLVFSTDHFVASKNNLTFNLESNEKGEIFYQDKDFGPTVSDSIVDMYEALRVKIFRAKGENRSEHKKELEQLHDQFKDYFASDPYNSELNDMLYYDYYLDFNPGDKRVDEYILSLKEVNVNSQLLGLLFSYFDHRMDELDFENLNYSNYDSVYVELMSIAAYRFLRKKENRGVARYKRGADWLKTTDFYKRDSVHIHKYIYPLDNNQFKEKLMKTIVADTNGANMSFADAIEKHPSPFYLIDIWATWCAPCIYHIKGIKTLDIPKSIKMINLSVDKAEDLDTWKDKSDELELQVTYWFDETLEENKDFSRFIELKSLPRYILLDKDLNLIDEAFYQPHEPSFINRLMDIKNHKEW